MTEVGRRLRSSSDLFYEVILYTQNVCEMSAANANESQNGKM